MIFDKQFNGSSQNVIKNVLLKKADAGVVLSPELAKETPEVRAQIRTILKTQDIPSHPLAVHPRVALEARDAVTKAVLAIGAKPSAMELLRTVWLASPITTEYEKEYFQLEEVEVQKLSDWGQ